MRDLATVTKMSDCLLLDAVPSLSLALAHGTTYTCQCHLSTISSHLQKTAKTASVSTLISWALGL